jgi:hypothetical protein
MFALSFVSPVRLVFSCCSRSCYLQFAPSNLCCARASVATRCGLESVSRSECFDPRAWTSVCFCSDLVARGRFLGLFFLLRFRAASLRFSRRFFWSLAEPSWSTRFPRRSFGAASLSAPADLLGSSVFGFGFCSALFRLRFSPCRRVWPPSWIAAPGSWFSVFLCRCSAQFRSHWI